MEWTNSLRTTKARSRTLIPCLPSPSPTQIKLKDPVSIKEIRCVIKCLLPKKIPDPGTEFYQRLKEIILLLQSMFQKIEEGINTSQIILQF